MMQKSALNRWIVALLLVSATGCMGGPRQRPVKMGPVDQGPESIVAERKFLEGRWSLMQFQVFPQGKPPITLTGDGSLNYDEFGNLRIEIRADEKASDLLRSAGVDIRDGKISTDGRVVLDSQRRSLSYILDGDKVGAPAAGPLAPSRPRYWEIKGDVLMLSTKDETGRVLSTGTWKKTS